MALHSQQKRYTDPTYCKIVRTQMRATTIICILTRRTHLGSLDSCFKDVNHPNTLDFFNILGCFRCRHPIKTRNIRYREITLRQAIHQVSLKPRRQSFKLLLVHGQAQQHIRHPSKSLSLLCNMSCSLLYYCWHRFEEAIPIFKTDFLGS